MKYFLLIGSFIFTCSLYAQILPTGVGVKEGKALAGINLNRSTRLVETTDDGYLFYKKEANGVSVFLIAKDLSILNSIKLKEADLGINTDIIGMEVIEKSVYLFTATYNEDIFITDINSHRFDYENFEFMPKSKVISKETNDEIGKVECALAVSKNKMKVVLRLTTEEEINKTEGEQEIMDVIWLNTNLEIQTQRDSIVLSLDDNEIKTNRLQVTNDGMVTMFGSSSSISSEEGATIEVNGLEGLLQLLDNYQKFVIVIKAEAEPIIFEFKLDDYDLKDLEYVVSETENIQVVGYYKSKEGTEQGFYFANLNPNSGKFVSENLSVFGDMNGVINSNSHFEDVQVTEALRLTQNIHPKFSVDHLFTDEDGVIMVGESTYPSYYSGVYYHYGIAVVKFSQQGEILWQLGVPKIQYADIKNNSYCGYGVVQSDRKISFIYNFSPIKATNGLVEGKSWNAKKSADLYLAQVDKDGELRIDYLHPGGKKPFWKPNIFFLTNDTETLIGGMNGKSSNCLKITVAH